MARRAFFLILKCEKAFVKSQEKLYSAKEQSSNHKQKSDSLCITNNRDREEEERERERDRVRFIYHNVVLLSYCKIQCKRLAFT